MIHLKNKEFFDSLYKENHKMIRNVIYNMVGEVALEDLVQDAFLKIWKGLSFFSFKSSIKTWVYRVAVNVAIDFLRTRKFKMEQLKENYSTDDNENREKVKSNESIVQEALMELDEIHRTVVVLFYFEDMKIQDIAKVLNTAEGTVKSRLHFAKHKLKDCLEKKGVEL